MIKIHLDENLQCKREKGLEYVSEKYSRHSISYGNHEGQFDWMFKLDDDTYLCYKHLKEFLQYYDPSQRWWIGQSFTVWYPEKYLSGGGGYAFSHELMQLISKSSLKRLKFAYSHHGDDRHLGRVLSRLGVFPQNTLTADFVNRFHQRKYEEVKVGNHRWWCKNCHPMEVENGNNEEVGGIETSRNDSSKSYPNYSYGNNIIVYDVFIT